MAEQSNASSLDTSLNRSPSESTVSDEPFECPHCGQLLASSCRVCVACKLPIDPARIRGPELADVSFEPRAPEPVLPPVRFSWPMFFTVLVVSWLTTLVALRFVGLVKGQLAVSGLQLLSAVWVFLDARQREIPKPLRWGVGSLILWIVIFPWYLVRRRSPQAPCPFVEAEAGPFTRVMLLVIFIFFLAAVIVSFLSGPGPK